MFWLNLQVWEWVCSLQSFPVCWAGVLIGYFTEYYTSDSYKPTQKLAETSQTGSATLIIGGLGLGMRFTAIPAVIVGIAVLVSYFVSGGAESFNMGLYGISLAAVGMLSTLVSPWQPTLTVLLQITLVVSLRWQVWGEEVRKENRRSGLLGNTTAATGKGFGNRFRCSDRSGSGCFLHRPG